MLDEETLSLAYKIGLYHIERGVRDFNSFKLKLIEDCGDRIRPYIIPTYFALYSSPDIADNGWQNDMTPYNEIIIPMDDLNNPSINANTDGISINQVISVFKGQSDKKKAKDIKASVCALLYPDDILAAPEIDEAVDRILREDKKLGDESYLTYSKGYYSKRNKKQSPGDGPAQISEYTGRAGECAVMSELLFHNYNVNRMMIDEGVDLVAVKDNIYYYIQVKTVAIRDGKIYAQINIENFDKFIGNQMRYVIVARCKNKDGLKNIFFTFSQQEISKGIYDRCVKRGEKTVSIKIKFHERSGEPIMYDEKEISAKWNMNRFEL